MLQSIREPKKGLYKFCRVHFILERITVALYENGRLLVTSAVCGSFGVPTSMNVFGNLILKLPKGFGLIKPGCLMFVAAAVIALPLSFQGTAPTNRKGHSAVVYQGSMYLYGGYIDIKGVSQEFWTFCFDTKEWCPVVPATLCGGSPGPRHGHAVVVYGNGMYLFGGLMGLNEQKDFWKWDFIATNWSSIRRSQGPPKVVGHSALIFQDSMLIFGGGISNTKPNGTLWKYHFPSEMWGKVASPRDGNPSFKAYHCLLGLGYGFQETADPSCTSLSHGLHRKEKRCSKLLALSKQHSCFCEYFQPEPIYQAFSNEDGNEIEMSTFHQPAREPGVCSLQTTSNAELSANQPAGLLSEKISDFSLSIEQDCVTLDVPEEEGGFGCLNPDCVDSRELSAVLLVVGGKPFSTSSAISFWQMELDII